MQIKTIGVLGCGLMGSGIAQISAAAGYKTIVREVEDAFLKKGLGKIEKFLAGGVEKGKVTAEEKDRTLGNLSGTTRLRPSLCSTAFAGGRRSSARTPRRSASPNWRRGRSVPIASPACTSST